MNCLKQFLFNQSCDLLQQNDLISLNSNLIFIAECYIYLYEKNLIKLSTCLVINRFEEKYFMMDIFINQNIAMRKSIV